MSNLDELKSKFIVSDTVVAARLEALVSRALKHCVVDEKGFVHFKSTSLSSKEKLKLALSARLLASQLEHTINAGINGSELSQCTGLPKNQVQARMKELIDNEKFAQSQQGMYVANSFKAQQFIESLAESP